MKTTKDILLAFYSTPEQIVALLKALSQDLNSNIMNVESSLKAGNSEYALTFIGQIREDAEMINKLLNKAKRDHIAIDKKIEKK